MCYRHNNRLLIVSSDDTGDVMHFHSVDNFKWSCLVMGVRLLFAQETLIDALLKSSVLRV